MRFNLGAMPPPIPIRRGEETATLLHRYLSVVERARAVEGLARGGLSMATEILSEAIEGWSGIEDEHGNALPFSWEDMHGVRQSHLFAVLGRLDFAETARIVFIQFAMNGCTFARATEVVDEYTNDPARSAAIVKEIAFFAKARTDGPSNSSAGSSTTATSAESPDS